MFILGLLALLQILFLPGFAILYALRRPPLRSAPWLAGSFGLSLLANYLAVSCLVCCRVYGPVSLWLLMAVEGVAITLLAIRRRELIPFLSRRPVSLAVLRQQVNGLPLPTVILWASASVVLVYYVQLFFANMGTGFVYRDPVVSWNRWALDWSMNQPAHHTWHYPQVLPTNWSIVYVLTGGPIWYFPKALMPLFPLGILFLLIYQYRHTREAGWLLAVPLFGVIAKALEYIPVANLDGYADMPVAFLALLTVLFYANRGCPPSRIHAVLALAFALTAALTKQAGLYIFGLLALALAVEAVMRKDPAYRRTVIVALLAATGVLATWYIPVEYRIRLGLDSSEVPWVTHGIYGNVSLLQRVARAPQFLIEHSYVLFLFFVLGVFHPQSRRWAVSIAIPYTVLWAGFWAYDARNLTLAMPFFAISAAFGVMMLDQWARRYVSNGWIAAIITLAILIAYVFRDPSVVHLGGYASLGPDGSSPHWVQARMQMVVLFSCLAAIALILAFRIPVWASLGMVLVTAVVLGLGPFSASTLHRHVEKDRPIMFSFEEHLQDRPLGSVTAPATGHTNGPSAPP